MNGGYKYAKDIGHGLWLGSSIQLWIQHTKNSKGVWNRIAEPINMVLPRHNLFANLNSSSQLRLESCCNLNHNIYTI